MAQDAFEEVPWSCIGVRGFCERVTPTRTYGVLEHALYGMPTCGVEAAPEDAYGADEWSKLRRGTDQHGEDDIVINAEKFVERLDLR